MPSETKSDAMAIQNLIDLLKSAKEPQRGLDGRIALILGFRKELKPYVDKVTGKTKNRTLWFSPERGDKVIIPYYTSSMDAAYHLAQTIAPNSAGAITWHGCTGKAVVDGVESYTAATPALALCISSLTIKMNRQG